MLPGLIQVGIRTSQFSLGDVCGSFPVPQGLPELLQAAGETQAPAVKKTSYVQCSRKYTKISIRCHAQRKIISFNIACEGAGG